MVISATRKAGTRSLGCNKSGGWGLLTRENPLWQHRRALPVQTERGHRADTLARRTPLGCQAFARRQLTSARPCRALLLLQPAGGFVGPRPRRPLPPPACPHLVVYIERTPVLICGSLGSESSLLGERQRGSRRAPRGCGCREREQVRVVGSRLSASQQLGPLF